MDDEEREAELTRLTQELEDEHDQRAERMTAEIMAKLDLGRLNAGINKTVNPTSLEAAHHMRYSMKDRYSLGWSDPRSLMIKEQKPDYNIVFQNSVNDEQGNPKQVQIGKIDFNGGVMKFEGNADSSAMVFMDSLATTFSGRLKTEHVNAAKLLLELVTFELDGESEVDSVYRKGFNDGMACCRAMLKKKIQEMERP